MFLVTKNQDKSIPFGGFQHLNLFKNFVQPNHIDRINNLAPGGSCSVTIVPCSDHPGYEATVTRCKKGY